MLAQTEIDSQCFEVPDFLLGQYAVVERFVRFVLVGLATQFQLLAVARRKNTGRQRNHTDADDCDHRAENFAPDRDRRDVAVADGGQCGKRPPHSCRNAAKVDRLRFALKVVHAGCSQQHDRYEYQERRGEGTAVFLDCDDQHVQRGKVARQLKDAHQAHSAQETHVDVAENAEREQVKRQDCEQVDDRVKREHES